MDYIGTVLGLKVTYIPWDGVNNMPYLITDRYEIQKVAIGTVPALMLKLKVDFPSVGTIQKHIARIQRAEQYPAFLVLESISKYRRDALIKAHIPFVVPGKQLYLPFLGVALNERCDSEVESAEKLLPSAQAIFFYYLYSKQDRIYVNDAVKDLQYSAMSVSRAAKQLVQTGLFEECKEGVQKLLIARYDRREMFERMRPLMIDPVKRRIYIELEDIPVQCCLAGYSAMAHYTMLNAPTLTCYAADVSTKLKGASGLTDADHQAEVEIWKYDPAVLCKDSCVDPLSLVLSLQENPDERTEEAIEELLEKFWEE